MHRSRRASKPSMEVITAVVTLVWGQLPGIRATTGIECGDGRPCYTVGRGKECVSACNFLMTIVNPEDMQHRFRACAAEGGWNCRRSGAGVRAPALLRRLSSFSSAGWVPHAKCASWGCLGLTLGDRHYRSQNWWRIPLTGTNALAAASDIAVLVMKPPAVP